MDRKVTENGNEKILEAGKEHQDKDGNPEER